MISLRERRLGDQPYLSSKFLKKLKFKCFGIKKSKKIVQVNKDAICMWRKFLEWNTLKCDMYKKTNSQTQRMNSYRVTKPQIFFHNPHLKVLAPEFFPQPSSQSILPWKLHMSVMPSWNLYFFRMFWNIKIWILMKFVFWIRRPPRGRAQKATPCLFIRASKAGPRKWPLICVRARSVSDWTVEKKKKKVIQPNHS